VQKQGGEGGGGQGRQNPQFQNQQGQGGGGGQGRQNPQFQNPQFQNQQGRPFQGGQPRQQFQTFQPQYQQRGNRNYYNVGNTRYLQNNPNNRFLRANPNAQVQPFGRNFRTVTFSPNGTRVVTITDSDGRLIRRSHFVNGQEFIMIDNRFRGPRRQEDFFVSLPPPVIRIPQNRYIVDAGVAPPDFVYGALMAPPVAALQRQYTLDEVRFSPDVRNLMPRVDIDTITFASSSSELTPDQFNRLAPIADGIKRAVSQNASEVFLIEGHTDAVGETDENLSLSDRRAEAVAEALTSQFQIPPENLTTQGYGEQQLKIPTQGPERANRRVTVRRITPLLQQGQASQQDSQPDDQQQDNQQQDNQQQFAPQQQQQQFAPAPQQQQFAPRQQ
jgi:outer membrane protein OmpA-like peptidoglycan-associated protein